MNDSLSDGETDGGSDGRSWPNHPATWSVGIDCRDAHDFLGTQTRYQELTAAGASPVRLFVRTDTVVLAVWSHLPVTVLADPLSRAAGERLMVAELLMRASPGQTLLLIDPVVSDVNAPGIHQWRRNVTDQISDSLEPLLFVDSRQAPKLHALSTETAKGFLSDVAGLSSALNDPADPLTLGSALIDWADRAKVATVEIQMERELARLRSVPPHDTVPTDAQQTDRCAPVAGEDVSIRFSESRVSVVVPTWNCGEFLAASLRSLLQQTVAAEVIVVDDASTDGTNRVLEIFNGQITIVRHSQRRGANAARNTGLAAASGDFIAFADADNEYSPHWIERLLVPILSEPESALAYCGYSKQSPDGSSVTHLAAPWDIDTLWFGNYIDMSSVLRRSAIPDGGLTEGFRPFDDWRLWLKFAEAGWRGIWVKEKLFVKHVRAASKTAQSMANCHERGRDIADIRREFSHIVGLDKPVSVVIPATDCEDLTTRCLAHLGDYCGVPFDVVYVDNGSRLETLDSVARSAEQAGISLRMIRNSQNLGFTRAVNQGIEASGESNVLVLNNDCFIGPGCVENLSRELKFNPRVAAAGPLTGDDGKQSLKTDRLRSLVQLPGEILDELDDPVGMSFRFSQKLRSVAEPVLSFYCALLRSEALDRYGALDPQFSSGLAADDEWCFRVRNHGQEVRLVLNAYAAHLHRSSFERLDIDRDALQRDAQQRLHKHLAQRGS